MTGDLVALAERVERATGADTVLDRDIVKLIGWADNVPYGERDGWRIPLPFTASLDAAMSLVPEGWGWLVSQPNAKALASGLLKERMPVLGEVQYGCDHLYAVAAATPALALVSAALRARAQESGHG